jgi:hypothetical protein
MKLKVFLLLTFLVSCVGTVEQANKPKTDTTKTPKTTVTFPGVHSVVGIAHDKVDVFFYPATGGTENYDYIIYYGGFPFPLTVPSEVLTPDYRGLLKYTIGGLNQAEDYQIRMDVQDQKTGYKTTTNKIETAGTFDNRVCDFEGIGSVSNLAGVDGLDSINVRWPHASKDYGSITGDTSSDPVSYEIVALDANLLTPESFDERSLTTAQGRFVKYVEYSITQNESVFRGLPSGTRFYVRVRAIHEDSVDDQTQPQLRSELNSDYLIIETLNNDTASIDWDPNGVEITNLTGQDATRAVIVEWPIATGVFEHYRVYYAEDGIPLNNATLSAECVSGELNDNMFCKKIDFTERDTLIANLEPSKTYNFQVVICRTAECGPFDRILANPKQATTFPNLAPFGGLEEVQEARFIDELGSVFLKFTPPNFTEGWVDGLIIGVKYTTDPDPSFDKISEGVYAGPLDMQPFDYTKDSQVEIRGVEYNANKLYCFTIYPFIYDEFDQKVEYQNDAWTCFDSFSYSSKRR